MATEKLRPTFTFTQDRLADLRAVLPEVFADGEINWETLREALGDYLEDEGAAAEHFGLFWPGKRDARRLAAIPSKGTLRPAPDEGSTQASTGNLFIEGDNLEVLKILLKSYAGQVKVIYIDPPYNTGSDFVYKDDYREPLEEFLRKTGQADDRGVMLTTNPRAGGRFHSAWLNMIYPRLLLARQFLTEDGVLFVSIDDNEVHTLRLLLNEVFGEENFIASIIWQKNFAPKNTAQFFSEDHDYILAYAKSTAVWRPGLLPRSEEATARYSNPDGDERGPWTSGDLLASLTSGQRGKQYQRTGTSPNLYEVVSPSGRVFSPPAGNCWRVSKAKFEELCQDNRISWGSSGNNMPRLKRFLSEVKQGVIPQTIWKYEDVGHTQEASQELKDLFPDITGVAFPTPKPTRLIRRMLEIGAGSDEAALVMDFFAGSASTGHAVLEHNAVKATNHKVILVQIQEPLANPEQQLRTIADIGKERMRRVIARMRKDHMKQSSMVSRNTREDLGFKVYKLDRSTFKAWQDYDGDDLQSLQSSFDEIVTPLLDGWKPDDLLAEVQLIEGFPLDSRVEPAAAFTANTVQHVTSDAFGHHLYVCLDAQIDGATIEQLGSLRTEDIFVCLDSGLTDEAKQRLMDICTLRVI